MTDLFIKPIPLPIPRPSGLETEYPPSTDSTMPLEGPRKAVDAFSGGESYHHSGESVNRISELPRAFKHWIEKIGENMTELLAQTYPHYVEPGSTFVANFIEFVIYTGLIGGVLAVGYLLLRILQRFVSWVVGNK